MRRFNQVAPFQNVNHYLTDHALQEAVCREGGKWAHDHLIQVGQFVGAEASIQLAQQANRNPPQFISHDPIGNRVDSIQYHPAYHQLMDQGVKFQVSNYAWNQNKPGAHVARAALPFLYNQVENGVNCPLTMAFASYPVIATHMPEHTMLVEKLCSTVYDPRDVPMSEKLGILIGMSMTEKQGGSDVRSNETIATKTTKGYLLKGHKWFTSAPMGDAFLTLAQVPEQGLSCFLVPRWLPDGTRNRGFQIIRLKDKLGDRSNASSEIEYNDAWGELVGEEGRGVQTIIDMVAHTRLDCTLGSASQMRWGVANAVHYAKQRRAFGDTLINQPLMQNVLCDLIIESEAATALAFRIARSFDDALHDSQFGIFSRLSCAVAKYWVCKRAPMVLAEAMECLGGNGYIEDFHLARVYRQAPLNSIWEGSGNVMCLDVLRTLAKEASAKQVLMEELEKSLGYHALLDSRINQLKNNLANITEGNARALVGEIAILLQGSLLVQHGNPAVAELFCQSRLNHSSGENFGTLNYQSSLFMEVLDRMKC